MNEASQHLWEVGKYYHPYFTDRETEAEWLNDLLKSS